MVIHQFFHPIVSPSSTFLAVSHFSRGARSEIIANGSGVHLLLSVHNLHYLRPRTGLSHRKTSSAIKVRSLSSCTNLLICFRRINVLTRIEFRPLCSCRCHSYAAAWTGRLHRTDRLRCGGKSTPLTK